MPNFNNKELNLLQFLIFLFPVAILLRSTALNFYLIVCAVVFLIFFFKKKIKFSKDLSFFFYFLLCTIGYLILISFNADNIQAALKSSISQLRFLFYSFLISFFLFNKKNTNLFISTLYVTVFFVNIDTLYQYFNGQDLFGIKPDPINNPHRLSGPFGTELIVGSFISAFTIPIISYLVIKFKKISFLQKNFLFFLIFFSLVMILLSGERMSLIMFIFAVTLILIFNLKLLYSLIILGFLGILLIGGYKFNESVQYRFDNFKMDLSNFKKSNHAKLFSSSVNVWNKNNKWIGNGLKNYRINCDQIKYSKNNIDFITNQKILCSSHPHNLYFEILSESGIVGFILFISFFGLLITRSLMIKKNINDDEKVIFFSSLAFLISYLWPIKSSGSFFSTYTASYFWFYLGIMFSFFKLRLLNKPEINSNGEKINH